MRKKITFPSVVIAALWVGLVDAQGVSSCAAYDLPCIERGFVLACRIEESTHESCMGWLRELEASPISDSPNARLTTASVFLSLSETSEAPEDAELFRDRALQIYRDLVAENPANVEALVGLVGMASTSQERVTILRQIVAIDPNYALGWETLASLIDDSDEPEDLAESAQYLEYAYNATTGDKKWHLASNAVSGYRLAGSIGRADELIERVREDFELDRKTSRFEDVARISSSVREETLQDLCMEAIIIIFGGTNCLNSIDAVVEFVNDASSASMSAISAAEDAASAMVLAARSGVWMEKELPNSRNTFLTWMDEILASGKESASLYVAYARLSTDKRQRLMAMQNAARLAPLDGEIAFGLGLIYFDLEQWTEAGEALRRASNLLPEERHEVIEGFMERASNALTQGGLRDR